MENYSKGKNVEEPLSREKIPIPDLPTNFVWMQVSGGSKIRNLLDYAMRAFEGESTIVWSASGFAIGKAIGCVEIMKRTFKSAYQLNKICYRKVEEYWEPQLEGLDSLVVVREVPTIHILLSKDPLNTAEPGYQAPGTLEAFEPTENKPNKSKNSGPGKNRKSGLSAEEFAAMGLRTKNTQKQGKQRKNVDSSTGKIYKKPNEENK